MKRKLILLFIILTTCFIRCSNEDTDRNNITKQDSINNSAKGEILFLSFRHGMDRTEFEKQLEIEVKNGNLWQQNGFTNLTLSTKTKSLSAHLYFDFINEKLTYISLNIYDRATKGIDCEYYHISDDAVSEINELYKSKFGICKTKDFYACRAEGNSLKQKLENINKPSIKYKAITLSYWETKEKYIVIEKIIGSPINNEMYIFYYPLTYPFLEKYQDYNHPCDSLEKFNYNKTKNNI